MITYLVQIILPQYNIKITTIKPQFLYKKQVSCLSYADIRPVTCFNLSCLHRDNLKCITKSKNKSMCSEIGKSVLLFL